MEKGILVPIILIILAVIYIVSPVDLAPDVPFVGWVDDVIVGITAGLYTGLRILKGISFKLKLLLIALFAVAGLLVVFSILSIVRLMVE